MVGETKSPLVLTFTMFSTALPVFVRVTLFTPLVVPTNWPEKVRLLGERPTTGAVVTAIPVPVRLTVWVGSPVSSVIAKDAVRVPVPVGAKLTLTVQLVPA